MLGEKKTYTGEIVYWNIIYGFIKLDNSDETIFFHKNNINANYTDLCLLDKVTFIIGISNSGKHKGRRIAESVVRITNGDFSDHLRTIGILKDWNGKFGFLYSPQMEPEVLFYHSRLINYPQKINNGEYFTFSPVKSTKNSNKLFANFAYPLENEKDINFLREQNQKNNVPPIKKLLSTLIRQQTDKPIDLLFELELEDLVNQAGPDLYFSIVSLIKQYKETFNFIPTFELLKKNLLSKHLIQLWENNAIEEYDLEIMKRYFHNSLADKKRAIINKFPEDDKAEILRYHFKILVTKGKFLKVNNDLKTFFDIVYSNKETQQHEIYKEAEEYVLVNISPSENVSLWLNNYIDDLPEEYIISHFDITNVPYVKRKNEKYIRIVQKIYENYLLTFAKEKDFDINYPELLRYLILYKKQFESKFQSIANTIISTMDNHQKAILWLFEPDILFGGSEYFENHWDNINIYFRIKFLIRSEVSNKDESIKIKVKGIDQEKILEFVSNFEWNDLIKPINEEDEEPSFLTDIKLFNKKFDRKDIQLEDISEKIYDSLPFYKIHHLRLWLFSCVRDNRFDYVGYRECFRALSHEEQEMFRKKGDFQIKEELIESEILEVSPCKIFQNNEGGIKTYTAFVENIYFMNGRLILRMENKKYTNPYDEPFSSTGLNRIPKSDYLNTFEFTIKVQDKEIIEVEGLNKFFYLIQTGEILGSLGKHVEPMPSLTIRNKSYVEDWKLRKEILNFLNEKQITECSPKIVNEPKSRYRRIEVNGDVDFYEKTLLYSIVTVDGYGIVWENIDMTEDRATFIFKATRENHRRQIENIFHEIVSYGQLRSTLKSNGIDKNLKVFKDNVGYVGNIHKQRGNNEPFLRWEEKLNLILSKVIPDLPNSELIKNLKNWKAEMPYTVRINNSIVKIKNEDIKVVTTIEAEEENPAKQENPEDLKKEIDKLKEEIFEIPKAPNSLITENESLKEKNSKMNTSIKDLQNKLQTLESTNKLQKDKNEELNDRIGKSDYNFKNELNRLEKEISELKSTKLVLSDVEKKLKESNLSLDKKNIEKNKSIDLLNAEIIKLRELNTREKDKIKGINNLINNLRAEHLVQIDLLKKDNKLRQKKINEQDDLIMSLLHKNDALDLVNKSQKGTISLENSLKSAKAIIRLRELEIETMKRKRINWFQKIFK